jgi:hypothetical protein
MGNGVAQTQIEKQYLFLWLLIGILVSISTNLLPCTAATLDAKIKDVEKRINAYVPDAQYKDDALVCWW